MPRNENRLFLVRLVDCIVNLSDFYSYRLIGKLTASLQLQESSLCRHIVACHDVSAQAGLLKLQKSGAPRLNSMFVECTAFEFADDCEYSY